MQLIMDRLNIFCILASKTRYDVIVLTNAIFLISLLLIRGLRIDIGNRLIIPRVTRKSLQKPKSNQVTN